MKHVGVRVWGAALVAVSLTALGLTGAAVALPSTPEFGDIDQSKTGSVIIHKHERQNGTSETASPDGSASISTPGIEDVEFTLYRVAGLDMADPATWDEMATWIAPSVLDDASAATTTVNNHALTTPGVKVTTDATGLATASNLPVGAYVVAETRHPSQVVDIAQPFIVTIPFPDNARPSGATNGWLYDVNVYPKNGVGSIDKSVTSQTGLGLGSIVSFPVTVGVAKIADNASFSYYVVHDPMDSRLTDLKVASVTVDGSAVPATHWKETVTGQDVDLSFTQAGLAWLKTIAGKQIVVTFQGKVNSLGADGIIRNKAELYSDTQVTPDPPVTPPTTPPSNPPTAPPTSPEVRTNWGDVVINKLDAADHSSGLSGAEFEVYEAQTPYASDCSTAQATGNALTVSSGASFVTAVGGKVTIPGLFVSDSKNAPADAGQRCYVIKEIKAPAGYVLPTGSAAFTPITVKTGVTSGVDVTVEDSKNSMPPLPLTGAAGLVVLTVAGVLLLGAAVFLVIKRRA
ncbi:type-2 fimbrial major subunit [Bombiscardovia apis]|uniref:Type-2 fimbrial major subunit n=1 Tax=Bombiscardovia apis TaxID=2932182 RepID=A0ABM8BC67_9BIFI|nr:SpaH/EbpB family LPXTG-anchored major pilin [Bombiscardovia apis]BDR54436.1 type-2 fimbrial major subunit [Bombiscardovia apis]